MGEGRWRCRRATWDEGAEGIHEGHFHIAAGMVVRGGRRQCICQPSLHMSQSSISPSSKGLWHTCQWGFDILGTLTYLALPPGKLGRDGTGPGCERG